MRKDVDLLISNAAQVLTMNPGIREKEDPDKDSTELGVIENGAVAVSDGCILDVGEQDRILDCYQSETVLDARQGIVSPGLVDPHTHLVFAGSRHLEFGMRMRNATYHQILESGGGIHSTVRATRSASVEELVNQSLPRLRRFQRFGVTTVEIKSGYGLDLETEIKMLLVIERLSKIQPVRLVPTYLGAHVVPLEYRDKRDAYVDLVTSVVIPEIARRQLACACDVFLDEGAFALDEATAILQAAAAAGMKLKIHAGQFTDKGGPELVSRLGGLSADHLEIVSDEGIEAMARAGVVANLLPGAAFSLRDHFPAGRRLIDGGVHVAVATDNNPGTSRTENLPLMASMAATRMGLTTAEAWKAMTVHGAEAIGMEKYIGAVVPGLFADLAIFSVPDFRALLYHFGINHMSAVIIGGQVVVEESRP